MSHKIEVHHCSICNEDTEHVVILVRKKSKFIDQKNRGIKEFFAGFIKSWALGPFLASMDEFERHLVCKVCGEKNIEP